MDHQAFALLAGNLVCTEAGRYWTFGIHGRSLSTKRYIVSGYNDLNGNPYAGQSMLGNGKRGLASTLDKARVVTALYGGPRPLFLSVGDKI